MMAFYGLGQELKICFASVPGLIAVHGDRFKIRVGVVISVE